VRTASRRVRRLGGLLLLAATVWWAFLRRRANAVRWVEPPATLPAGPEPGVPGELPDDVIATDAGLTELPEDSAQPGTVDEAEVAELLAESADADVVVLDETAYEQAIADAAPEPAAEPRAGTAAEELPEPGPAADEPTDPELAVRSGKLAEAATTAEPVVAEPDGAEAAEPDGVAVAEPDRAAAAAPDGIEDPTVSIRRDEAAVDDESGASIPMPTFSEAPTQELPAVTDDLRAVRGIGPSMERKLHGLGIVSYRQLALLDGAELERVRAELTDFRTRIEREDWVGQARALHREKYGRDPS
jgi:predicted flap endonuclease-1-like 5' DNA nuclease